MGQSISAYIQVYKHQRAVFEALKSFRTHYETAPITVLSDNGDDFSDIAAFFGAHYVHSEIRSVTGAAEARTLNQMTLDGIYLTLKRMYDHAISSDADWVVILEPDVRTIRQIRHFPDTPIAGARENPFSPALTDYLIRRFGPKTYVYGCAGGGIISRQAIIDVYEAGEDLSELVQYDSRVALYADLAIGLLFHLNDIEYSVWDEVSEILHETAPIIRDSAFDHGYKYWYDKEYAPKLLGESDLTRQ